MGNTFSRIAISTTLLVTPSIITTQAGGTERVLVADPIQAGGAEGGPEQKRTCDCIKRHQGPCHGGSSTGGYHISHKDMQLFRDALEKVGAQEFACQLVDRGIRNAEQLKHTHPDFLAAWGIPELTLDRAKDIVFLLKSGLPLGEPRDQVEGAPEQANQESSTSQPLNIDLAFLDGIRIGDFEQELTQLGVTNVQIFNSWGIGWKTVDELVEMGLARDRAETMWTTLRKNPPPPPRKSFVDWEVLPPRTHIFGTDQVDQPASEADAVPETMEDLLRHLGLLHFQDTLLAEKYQFRDLPIAEPDELINEIGMTTEQARRLVTYFRPEHPFGVVEHYVLSSQSDSGRQVVHEADRGYVEYTIQRGKDVAWILTDKKGVDPHQLKEVIPTTRTQRWTDFRRKKVTPSSWLRRKTIERPAWEIKTEFMKMMVGLRGHPVDGKEPIANADEWEFSLTAYGQGNWMMLRCEFPLVKVR